MPGFPQINRFRELTICYFRKFGFIQCVLLIVRISPNFNGAYHPRPQCTGGSRKAASNRAAGLRRLSKPDGGGATAEVPSGFGTLDTGPAGTKE